ncbi:zinc finger protein hypothetical protein [Limosa lapponica baueri]|uniref:C2H2-type domain-containing protein n=1 Tax=Limosa lapponica baueri TaxID=1758121 RepID=A0A2I0TZA1_LIMLA|nr:zinc finger protein hypothetical protein [Limosa lapponica baueri]
MTGETQHVYTIGDTEAGPKDPDKDFGFEGCGEKDGRTLGGEGTSPFPSPKDKEPHSQREAVIRPQQAGKIDFKSLHCKPKFGNDGAWGEVKGSPQSPPGKGRARERSRRSGKGERGHHQLYRLSIAGTRPNPTIGIAYPQQKVTPPKKPEVNHGPVASSYRFHVPSIPQREAELRQEDLGFGRCFPDAAAAGRTSANYTSQPAPPHGPKGQPPTTGIPIKSPGTNGQLHYLEFQANGADSWASPEKSFAGASYGISVQKPSSFPEGGKAGAHGLGALPCQYPFQLLHDSGKEPYRNDVGSQEYLEVGLTTGQLAHGTFAFHSSSREWQEEALSGGSYESVSPEGRLLVQAWEGATKAFSPMDQNSAPYSNPVGNQFSFECQPGPEQRQHRQKNARMPWQQIHLASAMPGQNRLELSRQITSQKLPFPLVTSEWQGSGKAQKGPPVSNSPGYHGKKLLSAESLGVQRGDPNSTGAFSFESGKEPGSPACDSRSKALFYSMGQAGPPPSRSSSGSALVLPPSALVAASPCESPLPSPVPNPTCSSTCSSLSPMSSSPLNTGFEDSQMSGALTPSPFFQHPCHPKDGNKTFHPSDVLSSSSLHYHTLDSIKSFHFPPDALKDDSLLKCAPASPFHKPSMEVAKGCSDGLDGEQPPPPYSSHHLLASSLSSASLDQLDVLLTCKQCDQNYSNLSSFLQHRQFCTSHPTPQGEGKDAPRAVEGRKALPSEPPRPPSLGLSPDPQAHLLALNKSDDFLLDGESKSEGKEDALKGGLFNGLATSSLPLTASDLDIDDAKLDSLITEALNGLGYQSDNPEIDSSFIDVFADEELTGVKAAGGGMSHKTKEALASESKSKQAAAKEKAVGQPKAGYFYEDSHPGGEQAKRGAEKKHLHKGRAAQRFAAQELDPGATGAERTARLRVGRKNSVPPVTTSSKSTSSQKHARKLSQEPPMKSEVGQGIATKSSKPPRFSMKEMKKRKPRSGTWSKELIHKIVQQKNKLHKLQVKSSKQAQFPQAAERLMPAAKEGRFEEYDYVSDSDDDGAECSKPRGRKKQGTGFVRRTKYSFSKKRPGRSERTKEKDPTWSYSRKRDSQKREAREHRGVPNQQDGEKEDCATRVRRRSSQSSTGSNHSDSMPSEVGTSPPHADGASSGSEKGRTQRRRHSGSPACVPRTPLSLPEERSPKKSQKNKEDFPRGSRPFGSAKPLVAGSRICLSTEPDVAVIDCAKEELLPQAQERQLPSTATSGRSPVRLSCKEGAEEPKVTAKHTSEAGEATLEAQDSPELTMVNQRHQFDPFTSDGLKYHAEELTATSHGGNEGSPGNVSAAYSEAGIKYLKAHELCDSRKDYPAPVAPYGGDAVGMMLTAKAADPYISSDNAFFNPKSLPGHYDDNLFSKPPDLGSSHMDDMYLCRDDINTSSFEQKHASISPYTAETPQGKVSSPLSFDSSSIFGELPVAEFDPPLYESVPASKDGYVTTFTCPGNPPSKPLPFEQPYPPFMPEKDWSLMEEVAPMLPEDMTQFHNLSVEKPLAKKFPEEGPVPTNQLSLPLPERITDYNVTFMNNISDDDLEIKRLVTELESQLQTSKLDNEASIALQKPEQHVAAHLRGEAAKQFPPLPAEQETGQEKGLLLADKLDNSSLCIRERLGGEKPAVTSTHRDYEKPREPWPCPVELGSLEAGMCTPAPLTTDHFCSKDSGRTAAAKESDSGKMENGSSSRSLPGSRTPDQTESPVYTDPVTKSPPVVTDSMFPKILKAAEATKDPLPSLPCQHGAEGFPVPGKADESLADAAELEEKFDARHPNRKPEFGFQQGPTPALDLTFSPCIKEVPDTEERPLSRPESPKIVKHTMDFKEDGGRSVLTKEMEERKSPTTCPASRPSDKASKQKVLLFNMLSLPKESDCGSQKMLASQETAANPLQQLQLFVARTVKSNEEELLMPCFPMLLAPSHPSATARVQPEQKEESSGIRGLTGIGDLGPAELNGHEFSEAAEVRLSDLSKTTERGAKSLEGEKPKTHGTGEAESCALNNMGQGEDNLHNSTPNPSQNELHKEKKPNGLPVTCDICSATFRSKPGLTRHKAVKHQVKNGGVPQPSRTPRSTLIPTDKTSKAAQKMPRRSLKTSFKDKTCSSQMPTGNVDHIPKKIFPDLEKQPSTQMQEVVSRVLSDLSVISFEMSQELHRTRVLQREMKAKGPHSETKGAGEETSGKLDPAQQTRKGEKGRRSQSKDPGDVNSSSEKKLNRKVRRRKAKVFPSSNEPNGPCELEKVAGPPAAVLGSSLPRIMEGLREPGGCISTEEQNRYNSIQHSQKAKQSPCAAELAEDPGDRMVSSKETVSKESVTGTVACPGEVEDPNGVEDMQACKKWVSGFVKQVEKGLGKVGKEQHRGADGTEEMDAETGDNPAAGSSTGNRSGVPQSPTAPAEEGLLLETHDSEATQKAPRQGALQTALGTSPPPAEPKPWAKEDVPLGREHCVESTAVSDLQSLFDDDSTFSQLFPRDDQFVRRKCTRVYGKRSKKPKAITEVNLQPAGAIDLFTIQLASDLSESSSFCVTREDPCEYETISVDDALMLNMCHSSKAKSGDAAPSGSKSIAPRSDCEKTDQGKEDIDLEDNMLTFLCQNSQVDNIPSLNIWGSLEKEGESLSAEDMFEPLMDLEDEQSIREASSEPPDLAEEPYNGKANEDSDSPEFHTIDIEMLNAKLKMRDMCFFGSCEDLPGHGEDNAVSFKPKPGQHSKHRSKLEDGKLGKNRSEITIKAKDKQYKCKVCFQWFLTLGELDFHKLSHNPSPPPTCYMCVQRKFSSREQLRDHLKEKHAKNKAGLWACGMCLKEISDVWMYNEHLREHATQFARKGQAQKSVMGLPACFGEDNAAVTQFLNTIMYRKPSRSSRHANPNSKHAVSRESKSLKELPFEPEAKAMKDPLESNVKVKPPAPSSSKASASPSPEHMAKSEGTPKSVPMHPDCKDPSRDCHHCGKQFPKPFKLQRHLVVHSLQKIYLCHKCPMFYQETKELRNHLSQEHGIVEEQEIKHTTLYACELCADVMHVIKKSFICSMCNYTFSKKEQYDRHMEKHMAGSNKTFKFRGVMRPGIASREGREKMKEDSSLREGMPPSKKRKVVHHGSLLPRGSPVHLDHTSDLQLIEATTPSLQAPTDSLPTAPGDPGAPQPSVKTEDLVGDFSDLLAEMEKSQFDTLPPPPCLSPSLPQAVVSSPELGHIAALSIEELEKGAFDGKPLPFLDSPEFTIDLAGLACNQATDQKLSPPHLTEKHGHTNAHKRTSIGNKDENIGGVLENPHAATDAMDGIPFLQLAKKVSELPAPQAEAPPAKETHRWCNPSVSDSSSWEGASKATSPEAAHNSLPLKDKTASPTLNRAAKDSALQKKATGSQSSSEAAPSVGSPSGSSEEGQQPILGKEKSMPEAKDSSTNTKDQGGNPSKSTGHQPRGEAASNAMRHGHVEPSKATSKLHPKRRKEHKSLSHRSSSGSRENMEGDGKKKKARTPCPGRSESTGELKRASWSNAEASALSPGRRETHCNKLVPKPKTGTQLKKMVLDTCNQKKGDLRHANGDMKRRKAILGKSLHQGVIDPI